MKLSLAINLEAPSLKQIKIAINTMNYSWVMVALIQEIVLKHGRQCGSLKSNLILQVYCFVVEVSRLCVMIYYEDTFFLISEYSELPFAAVSYMPNQTLWDTWQPSTILLFIDKRCVAELLYAVLKWIVYQLKEIFTKLSNFKCEMQTIYCSFQLSQKFNQPSFQ